MICSKANPKKILFLSFDIENPLAIYIYIYIYIYIVNYEENLLQTLA